MDLLELYKEHINPDADGIELYEFFTRFDLGEIIVEHPNTKINQIIDERYEIKRTEAMKWIFRNSKL